MSEHFFLLFHKRNDDECSERFENVRMYAEDLRCYVKIREEH